MKRTTTLIVVGLLAPSPALAEIWGSGNVDAYGTILNDLDKSAMIGTGMAVEGPNVNPYLGAFPGNPDISVDGFLRGTADPEGYGPWGEGNADSYGTVLR
jgi:hypothetical protein